MSNQSPQWQTGILENGFSSLASYLGLAPGQAVFANSLVVNPQGPSQRLAASDDLEGVSHQYVLGLSGQGSTALHLPLTPAQTAYVHTYIAQGTLHEVRPTSDSRYYPHASVFATLDGDKSLAPVLSGKTLVNSYVTEDVEVVAKQHGGKTLLGNAHFLNFVGKEYLHEQSIPGLSIPPGVVIYHPHQLHQKLKDMQHIIKALGRTPEQTRIWVKPTSLSGGQGVSRAEGATLQQTLPALKAIDAAYRGCGFGPANPKALFEGLSYFMPIVLEVDVGALPGIKQVVGEAGVQAALGPKGITHIETVVNRTRNGEYIGGAIPQEEDKPLTQAAVQAAKPLLTKMWQDGYRGYVGVDAIVAEKHNGELTAVLNEANTRLTGNSPLVGLTHRFAALSETPKHALSASFKFALPARPGDAFAHVASQMNGHLFKGKNSGYTGIIPAVIDVPPGRGTITCKAVMLANSVGHLQHLQKHMQTIALPA